MLGTRCTVLIALLLAIGIVIIHQAAKTVPDVISISRYSRKMRRHARWRGKYAPDFELKLLDGGTFRMADAAGRKIVALNFFATWCKPCRTEIPELNRYALAHRDDPFVLLGINTDEEESAVREFVAEHTIAFPVGIDAGSDIRRKFGIDSIPTTVLIDHQGRVTLYEMGAISNADVLLEHVVMPLLASIRGGEGISRGAYLAGQRREFYANVLGGKGTVLHGRAEEIAGRINCPCGREKRLDMCNCMIARRIKKDLVQAVLERKDDGEIIAALSRKYSVVRE
ncbi:MAG: redoxin domain-containing protein [bacterium]|nr:redoxin domain-containing protein [bacterium]